MLVPWLLASGCTHDLPSTVRIDTNENMLRGLYANRNIDAKEIIFAIPHSLALRVGDTLSDGQYGINLIGSDFDRVEGWKEWDKNTVYDVYQGLMLLNRMEDDEDWFWDPYVGSLPDPPDSSGEAAGATPDFWSEAVIQELEIPSLVREIMERKHIVGAVAEKNGVDEHKLRWATWIIRSRRFTTWDTVNDPSNDDDFFLKKIFPRQVEQTKGYLLPLIDMANHAHDPNAAMKISVNRWTRRFDDTSSFAIRALKPIAKDEEITIFYGDGDLNCMQMMDKYGFFLEGNSVDKKFDWKRLGCCFSTNLEEDEKEKMRLMNDEGGHGSRIDMLSFRIFLKQLMAQ